MINCSQDKNSNLDQIENILELIYVSDKIHVDTLYLLHIVKIQRKQK